jgi:uncharacterized protein (UPF0548 family)
MRRSTFRSAPLNYGAVGATRAPDLLSHPPRGYRSSEHRGRLGGGDERFRSAAASLLTWGVQRGAGLTVTGTRQEPLDDPGYSGGVPGEDGQPLDRAGVRVEAVHGEDGTPCITAGTSVVLLLPAGPFRVRAPARVVYVIDEPDRVGFAYGTLSGNPISGEESFVVERTATGEVWLTLREFSRPSTWFWRLGSPALRFAQGRMVGRYLRALHPATGDEHPAAGG